MAHDYGNACPDCDASARRIDALETENARLREACRRAEVRMTQDGYMPEHVGGDVLTELRAALNETKLARRDGGRATDIDCDSGVDDRMQCGEQTEDHRKAGEI